jgi:hypothetical protein
MIMVHRNRSRTRGLTAAVVLALLGGLAACTENSTVPVPQSSYAAPRAASPNPAETAAESTPEPARNDLAKLPLKRALNAGPLTVNVEYSTPLAIEDWRTGINKPIRVSLTTVNKKKRGQKIYLSKVTADVTAYDDGGVVDVPETLNDTSNINPGFIVTFPETYNQNFALPAVDDAAGQLVIDFTYELVLQASKDKDGRNFSKQAATDTVVVPINP